MDTGTHILMGISLTGIASIDATVATDPSLARAVAIAVVAGSLAPDTDTILKLRNNADYIKNHRGITHSIPAIFIWTFAIALITQFFFQTNNFSHLLLWAFIGVFLHVFVDLFNAYGTQALRPFSKKWIAFGVINTLDPILFLIYLLGVITWLVLKVPPLPTFSVIFTLVILYYLSRIILQRMLIHELKQMFKNIEDLAISPTFRYFRWHIAIITRETFYVAKARGKKVIVMDEFERVPLPDSPVLDAAKMDKNIAAFLSFSPVYLWEIEEYKDHYEVKFTDLRYRHRGHYPFVAIVQLDSKLEIVSSYTGWVFSEESLRNKLDLLPI